MILKYEKYDGNFKTNHFNLLNSYRFAENIIYLV
jgi:hypothetical protein